MLPPVGSAFSNSRERVRGDPQPSGRRWAQDAGGDPYRPAGGQDLETAQHHHARGRDIFKENRRFSEKTPQPEPHSVVVRPTWPQAAAGAEPTSALCDLVVVLEQEVQMANLYV